jgi:hypothetical protein
LTYNVIRTYLPFLREISQNEITWGRGNRPSCQQTIRSETDQYRPTLPKTMDNEILK